MLKTGKVEDADSKGNSHLQNVSNCKIGIILMT